MKYCNYTDTTIDSLLSDGLHPNDDGYKVMYDSFMNECDLGIKRPDATWN